MDCRVPSAFCGAGFSSSTAKIDVGAIKLLLVFFQLLSPRFLLSDGQNEAKQPVVVYGLVVAEECPPMQVG